MCRIVFVFFSIAAFALQSADVQPTLTSKEPLPWNLLENGGFEHEGVGLLAVGDAERDRLNPYSGRSSGQFQIKPGQTSLDVTITNGLQLERGKYYLVTGRMRSAIKSVEGEAALSVNFRTGTATANAEIMRQHGDTPWQLFTYRMLGTGSSALRFVLKAKGAGGDTVWLDDLYVGPANVELQWASSGRSGLFQAFVGDGSQFEFAIPPDAGVLAAFLNGQRLRDYQDFEALYGAAVVRLFQAPKKGDSLALVLQSPTGFSMLHAPGNGVFGLFEKAGVVQTWLPAQLEKFVTPNVDYAEFVKESIRLPSIAGLPAEWSEAEAQPLRFTANSSGRYSIVLRDGAGKIVRSLVENVRLTNGSVLNLPFDGRDETGTPLSAGTYKWEVAKRSPWVFASLRQTTTADALSKIWWSKDGWVGLFVQKEAGRPALVVKPLDAELKASDRKTVIFTAGHAGFVEARPDLYFYGDIEQGQIVKVEGGKPTPFTKVPNLFDKESAVFLAAYETAEGPGVFLSRSAKNRDTAAPNMPPALFKFDAKGELVAGFGEGGKVGAPELSFPRAIAALPNGDVLVADGGARAVLKRLGADGKAQRVWKSWRGGVPALELRLEDSEEALVFTQQFKARVQKDFDALYRSVDHIAVNSRGEIFLTTQYEKEMPREVQVYSPLGEWMGAIGTGPRESAQFNTYDYGRVWDTRKNDAYTSIAGISLDLSGNLLIHDERKKLAEYWAAAPRVSNLALQIREAAKAVAAIQAKPDALPSGFSTAEFKERYDLETHVVDFVDLARDEAGRGNRDDGCASIVRKEGLRAYRLAGAEEGSWFRSKLFVQNPGKPHILLVEYPDDAHRWTVLSIRHEGEWFQGENRHAAGIDGGYATGWSHALTNKEQMFSAVVYPRRETLTVYFSTLQHASIPGLKSAAKLEPIGPLFGAAASRVWLLELPKGLPDVAVEEPEGGVKRQIGEHRESMESLTADFGGPIKDFVGRKRTWIDRDWVANAFDHYEKVNAWMGMNTFTYAAANEDSLVRENLTDELNVILHGNDQNRLGISLSLFRLPVSLKDRPDLRDKGQVYASGSLNSSSLSLIYPEVQQYLLEQIVSLVKRQKNAARVGQVVLVLKPGRSPLWGVDTGFEELAYKTFQTTSGKVLADGPVTEQLARFKNDLREDWTQFRCKIVQQWLLRVRDELKNINPEMQLVLQVAAGSSDARYCGFDPALFKNQQNIRVVEAMEGARQFPKWVGASETVSYKPDAMLDAVELHSDVAELRHPYIGAIAASLVPNKKNILKPLIAALIEKNPRSISLFTRSRASFGAELELREFARAFRSLPHAPLADVSAEVLGGKSETLKAYRIGDGAVRYFVVINTTREQQKSTLALDSTKPIRDLVNGRELISSAGNRQAIEVEVPPYGIRAYRAGK